MNTQNNKMILDPKRSKERKSTTELATQNMTMWLWGSRQPMTGRLATQSSNATLKI